MTEPLDILVFAPETSRADEIAEQVRADGLAAGVRVASDPVSLRVVLRESPPDVVLSDFPAGGVDGFDVLALVASIRPDVPLIFVADPVGEERAVKALRDGAADFVHRSELGRLGAAIRRALEEKHSDERHARLSDERERLLAQLRADAEEMEITQAQLRLEAETSADAAASLEALGARSEAVLAGLSEGVFIVDGSGTVLDMNAAAAAIHGLDAAVGVGSDMQSLARRVRMRDPDGRRLPDVDRPAWRALRGESFSNVVEQVELADGTVRSVSYNGSQVRGEDGRIQLAVVTSRDITSVVEAEQQRELLMEALASERATLRAVIENAPMGILVADARARLILGNPAAEHLAGRPLPYGEDYQASSTLGVLRPDGSPFPVRELGLVRAALDGTSVEREESSIRRADGSLVHLVSSAAPIRAADGTVTGAVALFEDVTERKAVEEAVLRGRNDLQAAIDAVPALIAFVDRDGTLAFTNATFEAAFEAGPGELIGRLLGDVLGGELWQRAAARADRALAGETVRFEGTIPRRAGRPEGVADLTYTPRRDAAGVVQGFYLFGSDITALKRAEHDLVEARDRLEERVRERTEQLAGALDELRRREVLLRTVLDTLPVGVWIADPEGMIISVNSAGKRIWGGVEWVGPKSYDVYRAFWPETGRRIGADELFLARAVRDGEIVHDQEIEIEAFDGQRRTVLASAAPLPGPDGEMLGAVAVTQDITQRKEAEALLRHSEALLRKVLDTLPVGVWIADRTGHLVEGNPAGMEIWGGAKWTGVEGYGEYRGWWLDSGERIEGDDWALARAILRGETSSRQEVEIEAFDGTRKIILNWAAPLLDERGRVTGAVVVNDDITARKNAEDALRRYARRVQVLHEIDRAILAAASSAEIARSTVRHVREVVGCRLVSIVEFDFDRDEGRILAVDTDREGDSVAVGPLPLSAFRLLEQKRSGAVGTVTDIDAMDRRTEQETVFAASGVRAYAGIPLVAGGDLVGAIDLGFADPGEPTPDMLEIARQLADSFAIAMQSARLFDQVRQSRARLQELSRRLVAIQEKERRAIAGELHDEAGQALTGLMIGLSLLEKQGTGHDEATMRRIARLKEMTSGIMENLHRLAMNLRPTSLDRLGFVAALRQHLEDLGREHGLETDFEVVDLDDARLPEDVETALYRVGQEALTNVLRHASATSVSVLLKRRGSAVAMIIEDDGRGFDVGATEESGRLGLYGMQERAAALGGRFTIESSPGSGTTVLVEVPVATEATPGEPDA